MRFFHILAAVLLPLIPAAALAGGSAGARLDGTWIQTEKTEGYPRTVLRFKGDTLRFGPIALQAMNTPGHTPGSCCLQAGNWLFTGDTLFRGSCGRTDFPGGDWRQMIASLRRLGELEGDLYVYPGHGDASTLDHERRTNPYLREAMAR